MYLHLCALLKVIVVFQEFLRNLPDCLFLCDMFDLWAKALNIQDETARKQEIKR